MVATVATPDTPNLTAAGRGGACAQGPRDDRLVTDRASRYLVDREDLGIRRRRRSPARRYRMTQAITAQV